MSPKGKCAGCKSAINTKHYLVCSVCTQKYDLLCANVPEKGFSNMSKENRRVWQCPECRCKTPKADNTNTPVRGRPISADATDVGAGESSCENLGYNNVTLRAHQRERQSQGCVCGTGITLDSIRDVIKQEISAIVQAKVTDQLKAISDEMSSFYESLSFISGQCDDLKSTVEVNSGIILKLQSDNALLQSTVNELSTRLSLTEQHMRESNLEINGVPEIRSENLVSTVMQLAKTVEYPISEDDILNVTRVAKLVKNNNDKPRSVIVKLRCARQRDAVLAAVIRFNKKNTSDKLSSQHLGLGGARVPIFVSEHLTPDNKALHAATRKKSKEKNYKFCWVRNGRIYVRRDESCQAIYMRNYDSLKLIV